MPFGDAIRDRLPGRRIALTWAALALAGDLWIAEAAAQAETRTPVETAFLPLGLSGGAVQAMPRPLSEADADRYARIFRFQAAADWPQADREIRGLRDKRLLGTVQAQRYLHPKYKSRYAELAAWLKDYADSAEAGKIYRLAVNKKPGNMPAPPRPASGYLSGVGDVDPSNGFSVYHSLRQRSDGEVERVVQLASELRRLIRNGDLAGADRLIRQGSQKHLLDQGEFALLRAEIAAAYFHSGHDKEALAMAQEVNRIGKGQVANGQWIAGLSAWRLGRHDDAARHFAALIELPEITPWMQSAGAFWAARSNLRAGRLSQVTPYLARAALNRQTFYGLLARRALGVDTPFNFAEPRIQDADLKRLQVHSGGARALALIQVGEFERAEAELRRLYPLAGPDLAPTILALAQRANMPALSMRLAGHLMVSENQRFDSALYPIPEWQPEGGFAVEPALIFAIMRQESAFNPGAISNAGARGLMQLMPATAVSVSDGQLQRRDRDKLKDPEQNLTLGQRYLQLLIEHESIQGNLLITLAAYNAGPTNALRWHRGRDHRDDPLLFIEAIPFGETRTYVQRVLANYWIYQLRMSGPTPTLDALAAGDWPFYR
jgi:soluble lytic murein transglycosylase-like protein